MPQDRTALTARVTGGVQGVGFRAWARDAAERRGVRGWVRNMADGSVEARLIGPAADVADMVEALRRGPPGASVTGVETKEAPEASGQGPGFRIARNG